MSRYDWFLALGAGCIVGCATTDPVAKSVAPAPREQLAAAPPAIVPTPVSPYPAAFAPSPYHAAPVVNRAADASPVEPAAEIQPVAHAQPTAVPEPPRPLPPVETAPPVKPVETPAIENALHYLLAKRSEDAVIQLMRYDKPTQDLLLRLLPPVARLSEGGLDKADPQELSHLMDQLESALAALRPRAPLILERMCFCRGDIPRYGVQQPLPEYAFRPGEMVEVYVELRNFTCERHGPYYEIRLASSLEIRDSSGRQRWHKDYPDRAPADRSKSPRRDHFLSYRFYIPECLREGPYTLHLHVNDAATQRPATEASIDFRVVRPAIVSP